MSRSRADEYTRLRTIGEGSYGEVFEAVERSTGRTVALKIVDLEKSEDEVDVILREISVMSQLNAPNVVQYYTSFMEGSQLWIIMEFMNGGSLKDLVDSRNGLQENAIQTVCLALVTALDYIHAQKKLHRDIKAANVLLSTSGDIKLADFGVAGQLTQTVKARNTTVGSPFWMAPEVINANFYDAKADIWSLGITAYEIATGRPPHAGIHPMRVLFIIPNSDPPRLDPVATGLSPAFCDFVATCLRRNPAERPSASQLLRHPFLKRPMAGDAKDTVGRLVVDLLKSQPSRDEALPIPSNGTGTSMSRKRSLVQNPNNSLSRIISWDFDPAGSLPPTSELPAADEVEADEARLISQECCRLVSCALGRVQSALDRIKDADEIRPDEDVEEKSMQSDHGAIKALVAAFAAAEEEIEGVTGAFVEALVREVSKSDVEQVTSVLRPRQGKGS